MSSTTDDTTTIPDIMIDNTRNCSYKRLRFLGKGGFAKCYEIQHTVTKEVFAGKIVPKANLRAQGQIQKMAQEITIHRSLSHERVVRFRSFFEDTINIYIVLDLCERRSLMELQQRRKTITEPETRFFMHQILEGVRYLHAHRIIHRDLTLGNLFLDNELHVKIGDFGLASRIEFNGTTNRTVCGTPNYIAPEILFRNGHSLEVDIWSLGCIMYTLLVGKPPFESSTVGDTYKRVKNGDYRVPPRLSKPAKDMIVMQLQGDPANRPPVDKLLKHQFFTSGIMPAALPLSCLTTEPGTDQLKKLSLPPRPLHEINFNDDWRHYEKPVVPYGIAVPLQSRQNLTSLRDQLYKVISSKVRIRQMLSDDQSDPSAQPLVWISKWVDYSPQYGFGFQLCDESAGVMFTDTSKIIMFPNGVNVHYITREGQEIHLTMDDYPPELDKKIKVLKYFRTYMSDYLMKAGASAMGGVSDGLPRLPHLQLWFRATLAVFMCLSNGTVQINFQDHTKIILCPLMQAVTYIDVGKNFRTFRFSTLEKYGCDQNLLSRLTYTYEKLTSIVGTSMAVGSRN